MKDWSLGVIVGFVVGCIITALYANSHFYKEGQIDCINGAVYYTLVKQMDGTTRWEKSAGIVKP